MIHELISAPWIGATMGRKVLREIHDKSNCFSYLFNECFIDNGSLAAMRILEIDKCNVKKGWKVPISGQHARLIHKGIRSGSIVYRFHLFLSRTL